MTPLQRFTDQLTQKGHKIKQDNDGWYNTTCPAHEDSEPSFGFKEERPGGTLGLKCFAGCKSEDIVKAIGLTMKDLYPASVPSPAGNRQKAAPVKLTLSELAESKGLTIRDLARYGVKEIGDGTIGIPYFDQTGGKVIRTRIRTSTIAKDGSKWEKCSAELVPYGLDHLVVAKKKGYQIIVEGESDCWTLWSHDQPGLGIPGATLTKVLQSEHMQGIDRVYVVQEPDKAGQEFPNKIWRELQSFGWNGEMFVVVFKQTKDVNALYLEDRPHFVANLQSMLDSATLMADETWPDPEELDLGALPEPPDFDLQTILAATPDFCDFVTSVQESLQVPAELVAMLGLSIVSLSISGAVVIELNGEWKQEPPIWTVISLDSGSRKSAVVKVLCSPLDDWCRERASELKPQMHKQQQRKLILEAKLKRQMKGVVSGSPEEDHEKNAIELRMRIEEEPDIKIPQLIANDCTPEALCELLVNNRERVGIISAEGDIIDIILGRYGDGKANLGIFLQAANGESYSVNRRGRDPLLLESPCVVMAVAIQPQVARELVTSPAARGRGLVARFLMVEPKSNVGKRKTHTAEIPQHLKAAWSYKIRSNLNLPRPIDLVIEDGVARVRGGELRVVRLDPDAKALFLSFIEQNEFQLGKFGDLEEVRDFGSKLSGHLARIALSMHFLGENREKDLIDDVTMRSALAFAPFLIGHYRRLVLAGEELKEEGRVARALEWLSELNSESFTFRDFHLGVRSSAMGRRKKDWKTTFDMLGEKGYFRQTESTDRVLGRPSEIYKLNPKFRHPAQNSQNHKTSLRKGGCDV